MAQQITIPIEDTPGSPCVYYYTVEYKFDGFPTYTLYPEQFYISPIVLTGFQDGALYNIRITRTCCDGVVSDPVEITIEATPILAVTGLTINQVVADAVLDWDDMSGADEYEVERGILADYSDAVNVYTDVPSTYTDTGLAAGTYYYRVRQVQNGVGGAWANDSITLT